MIFPFAVFLTQFPACHTSGQIKQAEALYLRPAVIIRATPARFKDYLRTLSSLCIVHNLLVGLWAGAPPLLPYRYQMPDSTRSKTSQTFESLVSTSASIVGRYEILSVRMGLRAMSKYCLYARRVATTLDPNSVRRHSTRLFGKMRCPHHNQSPSAVYLNARQWTCLAHSRSAAFPSSNVRIVSPSRSISTMAHGHSMKNFFSVPLNRNSSPG